MLNWASRFEKAEVSLKKPTWSCDLNKMVWILTITKQAFVIGKLPKKYISVVVMEHSHWKTIYPKSPLKSPVILPLHDKWTSRLSGEKWFAHWSSMSIGDKLYSKWLFKKDFKPTVKNFTIFKFPRHFSMQFWTKLYDTECNTYLTTLFRCFCDCFPVARAG